MSLCVSCSFARAVRGRHGQRYLLCRNETIPVKYPLQPVVECPGFALRDGVRRPAPFEEDGA
jgi:hypothetical protein